MVLSVDGGQQQVPQVLQRPGPGRFPPGAGHRRGRQHIPPLPRHGRQVTDQGGHHFGVVRAGDQRHQQNQPDRQSGRHRPPRLALDLDLARQRDPCGDLADYIRPARQRVQPFLGQPQPGVISRMTCGLHPPVPPYHRRRDRHRLAEHHQVPGNDLPRAGRDQRRAAVLAQLAPSRRGQVRYPDRDHRRLPEQRQAGIAGRIGGDIRRDGRIERHTEAPRRKG